MVDEERDDHGVSTPQTLAISVAVFRSELRGFKENIAQRLDGLEGTVKEALRNFVTREEHETLKGDFKDFKGNIVKLNMIVLGLFIVAIAILVFKAGLVRT